MRDPRRVTPSVFGLHELPEEVLCRAFRKKKWTPPWARHRPLRGRGGGVIRRMCVTIIPPPQTPSPPRGRVYSALRNAPALSLRSGGRCSGLVRGLGGVAFGGGSFGGRICEGKRKGGKMQTCESGMRLL